MNNRVTNNTQHQISGAYGAAACAPAGMPPAHAAAASGDASPVRRVQNGDICPFAIPVLRFGLDKGDPLEAVRTVAEVCALLTEFRQLPELWLYQMQARECIRVHLAAEKAAAETAAGANMLTAGIARLRLCASVYALCGDLGLFTDVAYDQRLQPLGASWDTDVLPLQRHSTVSAKIAGTALWKKYMRRRIQQFKRPEDQELANVVDARFAVPLQAFCRRFVAREQRCCLAAAARRALAQEQYKDLPLQYRGAAACMQACLRRRLLTRRYAILRDACVEFGIQILADWKKLPSAQQLAVYKYLQHGLDPKEPELDEFQAFMQQASTDEAAAARIPIPEKTKNKQLPPPPPPPPVFEEEERPPTPTFRNQDQGPNLTGEVIVGRDIHPEEGMRVIFSQAALEEFPELLEDSGGGIGTITWVDPEDADGDGVTGDICEVLWDKTGLKGDYRTGFEGHFRLAQVVSKRRRGTEDDGTEKLVGRDVEPVEGMKVVICEAAIQEFPELLQDSGGTSEEPGVGVITWVDPTDADGDGETGDICEVHWQKTGVKGDYRTGYEGTFRLALFMGNRKRREGQSDNETIVGLDAHPHLGMRVVLSQEAIRDFPEFLNDSGISSSGVLGAGVIMWIDEEDHDGDGHTGDVCEVEWERTGIKLRYDTGLDGNFRLAQTVPQQDEEAGMKLQKVFRGHRSRRVLRNTLITKFLQEREMEDAYARFISALEVQCATRCHQSRNRLTFRRQLALVNAHESSIGPSRHISVPLRLQSVFRGHVGRSKLRSAVLSIFMIKHNVKNLWEEERDTRAYIKRAYFILHTHPRIRSWRNHTVRMLAHERYHAMIQKKHKIGLVWHAFCYWMQHSLDAKDRVDYVSLLIHRTWKHFVYMHLMKQSVYWWRFYSSSNRWLDETRALVASSHAVYLSRLKFEKVADFALLSREQRERAFRLRARITFAMCVWTMREWHICAWRRIVMRNVGDHLLPCWVEFLMWRCFCGLKFNGRKGEIILARAEIAKYALQHKLASVSKLSQSALIRYTKKRTGVRGPTRPLPQFTRKETAARTAAAMTNNDSLYRPLLVSKTFPYPTPSSAGKGSTEDGSERSGLSTPPYGSAGLARGQPKKKKKKIYKTNEEVEAGFWDARSKALLADSHNWEVPDGLRLPTALTSYTTSLPDLTRRPVRQTGAEILEEYGIEPKVLTSLKRPQSEGTQPANENTQAPVVRRPRKMAWETQRFDHGYGEHPDIRQALHVAGSTSLERKRISLHPRSNTALGRLEARPGIDVDHPGSFLPRL